MVIILFLLSGYWGFLIYGKRGKLVEEKVEINKINEIINNLEKIKQEMEKLKSRLHNLTTEEEIEQLFNKLYEITGNDGKDSVIFVNGNNVKYIVRPGTDGKGTFIVTGSKIYEWFRYDVHPDQHSLTLIGVKEYDLPNEVLELLNKVPESDISCMSDVKIRLYCLLTKGYKINLAKS